MPNFRRFLSRRWLLGSLAAATLLFGALMLHPYPRQSLFGPTIRGKPWCVWEHRIRRCVHREEYEKTLWAKTLRWLGADREDLSEGFVFGANKVMLPVLIEMSADPDPDVRRKAVEVIGWGTNRDPSSLPALRQRLDDDDAGTRVEAAFLIWDIGGDKRGIPTLIKEIDRPKNRLRLSAVLICASMADKVPELFDTFATLVDDSDPVIRCETMRTLPKFGKKSVPFLIQGIKDKEGSVRYGAMDRLGKLGPEAKDAIPALEELANGNRGATSHAAEMALFAIDPVRFAHFNPKRKIE